MAVVQMGQMPKQGLRAEGAQPGGLLPKSICCAGARLSPAAALPSAENVSGFMPLPSAVGPAAGEDTRAPTFGLEVQWIGTLNVQMG